MLLKEGVATPWSLPKTHPFQNEKEFQRICQFIAGKNRGKIIKFNTHQYPASFFEAEIQINKKDYWVRLNHAYPYIGFLDKKYYNFKKNGTGWMDHAVTYVDVPLLAEEFGKFYQVIPAIKLILFERIQNIHPLKKNKFNHKNNFNEHDLYSVGYWEPNTIGSIIFNMWD